MKKENIVTSILHYSYYRYYLHLKKQWDDEKSISELNLGFAYSAGALLGLMIFLIDDIFAIEKYVNTLIVVSISLLTISSFFLPKIDFLEDKYKNYDRTSKEWKIRGFLSLIVVFGPPILLIVYMFF